MTTTPPAPASSPAPRASVLETLGVFVRVLGPLVARGTILRRPAVVALAERAEADRGAVRFLQHLRARHGSGPLRLAVPGRSLALVLSPDDVHRVLAGAPEPFSPATREKRGALGHFEPGGLLLSSPEDRPDRRRFNEAVLDAPRAVHGMAEPLVAAVHAEASALADAALAAGELDWDAFVTSYWRMVREVVLGAGARDDEELTDLLKALRADGNWSLFKPRREALRERFTARLAAHLERAEPGSLAARVASVPSTARTQPVQQVPQWLFAYDAAAIGAVRALALLDAHPGEAQRVQEELTGRDLSAPQDLTRLRAVLQESLRLWATTPAVLRDTTTETTWETGSLPAGTGLVVFAPFFHRDDSRLPWADTFAPELWLRARTEADWPLIPFSEGPAECPGRNLVLLTTSVFMATLLSRCELTLATPRLDPARGMPSVLDFSTLAFTATPRTPAAAPEGAAAA